MTRFTVIPAQPHHCGQIWHNIRREHRAAVMRCGIRGHHELRAIFDQTPSPRAMFADDRLIALGGVAGPLLSPYGFIWVALSDEAKRYPLAIAKEARKQIEAAMVIKTELATTIIGGDGAAKRLAVFLGFHVAHGGLGGRAFSRYGRRNLGQFLDSEDALHVPIGESYAINLGYHNERHA